MLLPRYSLRWLLGLTTVSAGVSLILSYAVRGQPWALGVMAGLWSLAVVALFHVAAFLAAWAISRTLGYHNLPHSASAPGQLPLAAGKQDGAPLLPGTAMQAVAADSPPPMTG